ncbi:microtubule-associated protein futsch [Neodiprion virginianus]|uniref:microtubule-associated protein futsch n=1 Tax=Neodiprion virginianus TaxID=2961670 RepID=UPI001EE70634|nr:microtubule-associated protein futsch [Neodiprion virginianus]
MSTGEPAGEGGGGGGESTPGGDQSAGTTQTGAQIHPPPSPLSGCYLLVVLPEPHTAQHKDLIINRLAKGFLSWDKDSCHVDLEKELQALVTQAPEGEEARNGERLIQYATENLVTEVLIHPQTNTLLQCIRNLLASFTKHRHIIHAGYTFSGNGSWILQDGTFSLADFLDAFGEHEVQRVLRAYENSVTVDIHCAGVGDWTTSRLSKEACTRSCRVRVNPDDVLTAGVPAISSFTNYVGQYLIAQTLDQLMEPSDVVGNIRFSHPTLYVFPGGQGDAALFGINGFNMLVDGGFARKACFWDFARHLDRLDAVLLTRVNNSNIGGMSSVLRKKQEMHVYPQIGHFFCNLVERRQANSPDGDKDVDPLILNLTDLGQEMMVNLRHINLRAHPCYRDLDPINLYHKVGHGTLDMYVLSPSKDTREVREFLTKWQNSDSKLFAGSHKKDSNNLTFPIQNLVSICALVVWQPANPEDTITRILFPGSTPQSKIFEGLERLKHLEFMKRPICTAKNLSPSASLAVLKEKSNRQKTSIIEKSIDKDKDKDKDKDIKRISDYRKEKKETSEPKTVKGVEEPTAKPAVTSTPIIPTKQSAKVDVKAKKVVENKKIEKETIKTESRKIERDLKEVKKDGAKKEVIKVDKHDSETKKTDVVKTETEKTVITKESKPKPEPKKKDIKEAKTLVKTKVEPVTKTAAKSAAEKKLKPSIDKKDVKSSPTTPKKIVNGTATKTEITKTSTRTVSKTTSRTVSAMPAKSAKDATNRKVVESKNIALSSAPATTGAKTPSVVAKPKSTERKPISRRTRTGSPIKQRLPGSPAKSTRSIPASSVKSEKEGIIRRPKSNKGTTDSSAISTPSVVEPESVIKLADKSLTEKSDDISVDSIESKVLADLKEEREVVEEIEAVLSKAERNEIARKEDQLEGDDEITAEATDKKEDDVTEEDVTAEIEDVPKKMDSRKESQEFTEEDEYLIVEKEEIYTEDSAGLSGEGEQKHFLDEVESEKVNKYGVSKGVDLPEEEEAKEKDETEEKEKDEQPEKKLLFQDEEEKKKPADMSPVHKVQLEGQVKDIIASATDIVQKTDDRDDSRKKDSDNVTKEPSSLSPDKLDSSEKKTTDTDLKPEADQKDQMPEKLEESQDRVSTLESGGTTTAPTLPEDERIPLDEIKEDVDEKHVKEEVKEKEVELVKEKVPAVPPPVPSVMMKSFLIRETIPAVQRDIVKTPDEVADLPVHEEVDPKLYDMEEFDKAKDEKVPQTPEAKEPPTPPIKEQKGMFSFFGKVADKFEKGMDKLTGKSKKDTEKETDEKSSKSSSPKETKPQERTEAVQEVDMGKVFAKVGKIEPHDTFEKAKPQAPADIKVAAIKETASFLQQEIRESKIDTAPGIETDIPAGVEGVKTSLHAETLLSDIQKDITPVLDAGIDSLAKKQPSVKDDIVGEDLAEDTKEVEALLEEASKKFVTVKDSLRDSLESLEEKIAEQIIDEVQPISPKDSVKSTLTGVVEKLEGIKPHVDDVVAADSKEPERVKFEIPRDDEDADDDGDASEEYEGPVRDLKEAVRDVGEVLAGTAGIVIDDKPKDVIEIVKKVAEVLKEDNFLSEQALFETVSLKAIKSEEITPTKPEKSADLKPMIEDIIMPKKVGVTEELPPQEEIEEMLEGGIARPLPDYERAGGMEVEEEPFVKMVKDTKVELTSPINDKHPIGEDVHDLCSQLMDDTKDKKVVTPKESPKEHEGKIDVMEAGIEEVCTKKVAKRDVSEEGIHEAEDDEVEHPEILFEQKLSPAQAELVMVTPDTAPTSPKFTSDKIYDKELEDAVSDVSKVPGIPKDIEEFISSKADVYDIVDEVIKKGKKITIEIIEYIVIVKRVSREHVIYIIEEIIINKGIPPESVVEDIEILKGQDSDDLMISSVKRVEIEEYIITEYIMKGKKITVQIIEEIAIKKVVPKRVIIEIIEEIIIKRKISRESVYEIVEEEFIKQVRPIYDEYDREPSEKAPVTVDSKDEHVIGAEKPEITDEKLSPKHITPPEVKEVLPKADQAKTLEEVSSRPETSKEKDAPFFDEKDLDEGKLFDDFVNIPSKDVVINFLHEERRLSHEEHVTGKKDSSKEFLPASKTEVTDDTTKDSGDDFEAVEQEYKVHDITTTTATTFHGISDFKQNDEVLEAVEDNLDEVVEAAEKFVEETKEKPVDLKETPVSDEVTHKAPESPVKSKTQLIPGVKDDKTRPDTPDEKVSFAESKLKDVSDEADDDSVSNVTSLIASEISITTEKYLDEAKEKPTVITSSVPEELKDAKKTLDDVEHIIADVSDKIYDTKSPSEKLDKPEPKTSDILHEIKTDDHALKTITDKQIVDLKGEVKEPLKEEETHVKDDKIRSPENDKGYKIELTDDLKKELRTPKGKDIEDAISEITPDSKKLIGEQKSDVDTNDAKDHISPVGEKIELVDRTTPEPADIQKTISQQSVKDESQTPVDVTKNTREVSEKTDGLKDKEIVPEMAGVKILDTSEIVDLKQLGEASEKQTHSPIDAADTKFVDSSCFNIIEQEIPQAPVKQPLDAEHRLEDKLIKPKPLDDRVRDADISDEEPQHIARKTRSTTEDFLDSEILKPKDIDSKPTELVKKPLDATSSAQENEKVEPMDLGKSESLPESTQKPEKVGKSSGVESKDVEDDEDDKESSTVRRMVVTASSEDGGDETELCPTGSITFVKSVTPEDSLRDISTKSTPNTDSLQLEKDSLFSGKSSPEKDSISEKSVSELKDDKVTPEDSLEKSVAKEMKPAVSEDATAKSPTEATQKVHEETASLPSEKISEKPTEKISEKPTQEAPLKLTDELMEKLTDKILEPPTDKLKQQVPESPTKDSLIKEAQILPAKSNEELSEQLTEKIPEKLIQEASEKLADTIVNKPIENVQDLLTDKLKDEIMEKQTDEIPKKPAEAIPDKATEKLSEKITEKIPKKLPAEVCEKPQSEVPGQITEEILTKPTETIPVKSTETTSEQLTDKVPEEPKESVLEKPAAKFTEPLEKVEEKPKDEVTEKPKEEVTEKLQEVTPEKVTEKLTDQPIEKITEQLKETVLEKPSGKPTKQSEGMEKLQDAGLEKLTAEVSEKPKEAIPEKITEKSPEQPIEKIPEQLKEEVTAKSIEKVSEQPCEKIPEKLEEEEKPVEKLAEHPQKISEKLTEEISDKIAEKITPETPTEIPGLKSPEPTHSEEISPASTIFEKSSGEMYPETVEKETTGTLAEKDREDKSPTAKPSTVCEKLEIKDSTVEAPKDKSPISEKAADEVKSFSVAPDELELQETPEAETEQKEKPLSPTVDEKMVISTLPSIAPQKPDAEHVTSEKLEKQKSPSPTSGKSIDVLKSPGVASDKQKEEDILSGELPKEKSPSPETDKSRSPSITFGKLDQEDAAPVELQKDKVSTPTMDETADKSRSPSLTSNKLDDKHAPVDKISDEKALELTSEVKTDDPTIPEKIHEKDTPGDEMHKDQIPSPASDKESKTPSDVSVKLDEKDITVSPEQKDKSTFLPTDDRSQTPSISSEKTEAQVDEYLTPSITTDTLEKKRVPEEEASKDKSPSPLADVKPDQSHIPSLIAEKSIEKVSSEDRSPSPTTGEVTEETGKPRINAEKLIEKEIHDDKLDKDKSPSPTTDKDADKTRKPSITSGKIDEQDVPHYIQDKSPSPTADHDAEKLRKPSITSDKLDDKEISDVEMQKEKSPSPITDLKKDEAQAPKVTLEQPDDKDAPQTELPGDKSPSPTTEKVTIDSQKPSITSEKLDDKDQKEKSPIPASLTTLDKQDTPDEKILKDSPLSVSHAETEEKFPILNTDRVMDESRKPSLTADDKPDDKVHQDKSPSPTSGLDTSKSRKPSIPSNRPDEKDILDDELLKDKSPSPSSDKISDKSRSPSIAAEKPDEKDISESMVHKDKTSSPTIGDEIESHPRTPSISSDKLDYDDTPDANVIKDRSPSPSTDKINDKSRSPSIVADKPDEKDILESKVSEDKTSSPTIGDKIERHSRTPSISLDKLEDEDIPDAKISKDRSPSPSTDKLTDKSRSPSIAAEKPDEKDVLESKVSKDKTSSPTIGDKIERHSKTPSISSDKLDDEDISDAKISKDRSPSSPTDKISDKSRSPSIVAEKPDEKDILESKESKDKTSSPTIGDKIERHSRTPSISSGKLDDEDISDAKISKDRSPSPSTDKLSDKSRSPSIAAEKPDEKEILESKVHRDRTPSPTVIDAVYPHSRTPSITPEQLADKKISDDMIIKDASPSPSSDKIGEKSWSPSITSGAPDERIIAERKDEKEKTPSSITGDKTDRHSRTSSISSERLDDKDIAEDKIITERPASAEVDKITEKPSEKSDDRDIPESKLQKDKTPSPTISDKTDQAPSISPDKLDAKDIPKDKISKDGSPSPTTDTVSEKSRSPSVTSEKPDEMDILDSKLHRAKTPSPTTDVKTDQTYSMSPDGLEVKDILEDKTIKEKSPSPTTDKMSDKPQSPSITSKKLVEKDNLDSELKKDKSPSPTTDDKTDQHSRSTSISSEKLDVKEDLEGKVPKDRSPSPRTEETSEKSRSPKDKTPSPTIVDTAERHSTDSSISSDKLDTKDIPKDELSMDKSPSPSADKISDKSRSPSITSEKPDERDVDESKLQKDTTPSPTTSDKIERHSRTPSISSVKLDDKDIPDVSKQKDKSPSPTTDKATDKPRSPALISEIPDEQEISETEVQKDKSPTPTIEDKTDRHSRTSSISSEKMVEKDISDDKSLKDKTPSPTVDELTVNSRIPSIVPDELGDQHISGDSLRKDKSPSLTPDIDVHKSRASSISSVKLDEEATSEFESQKDKSPSPPSGKVGEQPDKKKLDDDVLKGTAPSPTVDKITDDSKRSSVTTDKLEAVATHADKLPKEQSPPSLIDDKKPKSPGSSVFSDIPGEKSRSPSMFSDKSGDEDIPTHEIYKDTSPVPTDDKVTDGSPKLDITDHKTEEKNLPKEHVEAHDKPEDKPAVCETPIKKLEVSDVPEDKEDTEKSLLPNTDAFDKTRSPSISTEEPEVKEKSQSPSPTSEKSDAKKLDLKIEKDKSPSPVVEKATYKSRSHSIESEKGDVSMSTEEPKPHDIFDDKFDANLDEKSSISSLSPSKVSDVLEKLPSALEDQPETKHAAHDGETKITEDDKAESVSKPSSTASDLLDEVVTQTHEKDDLPKSHSPLTQTHDTFNVEDLTPTHQPETPTQLFVKPDDKESKSPLPSTDALTDKPRSPSIVGEQLKSPSTKSQAIEPMETDEIPESLADGSVYDEPKSPRDRSLSHDRSPMDRSRSHSLFDSGDRTPLGRSRAASLFDDKLEDRIALLEFDSHATRLSISEETDEDRLPQKVDDSKPGSKSPSVGNLESPRTSIATDLKSTDFPSAKRLEIEQYILEEFILRNRKVTSEIIQEIVVKKSVPRYIVIEIIEEIIIKRKIPRESVIEVLETEELEPEDMKVQPKQTALETKETDDDKKGSPTPVEDTKPTSEDKKPREGITDQVSDMKSVTPTAPSTVSVKTITPELHVIKKRSVLDDKSPESDEVKKSPHEPKAPQSEKLTSVKDDSPESEEMKIERPSIVQDEHSGSKLDSKISEDQTKPDVKVTPVVVPTTDESKDIRPKQLEEEVVMITDAKRTEIEEYIMEEYIIRGRKLTREIVEEIVMKKGVPRYIILEIIEEIIIKRRISRVSVIDFHDEETSDKEGLEPTDRSTTSSISEKDDIRLRKSSEDRFEIVTGKSTPEISSAKDQTIDFSGKSTPDLKSSLLSEKYSDKSGYSSPDMRQFDERSGKSTPDYRTEYESQFHKAFIGGMTEIRTTHITTLSGKSTPDFGAGRDDTPEPKSESCELKSDHLPGGPFDTAIHDTKIVPSEEKSAETVPTTHVDPDSHKAKVPEVSSGTKTTDSEHSSPEKTSEQSTFITTISEITKAKSELVTKISESLASSTSTVTNKTVVSEHESKAPSGSPVPEDTITSPSTITTVKTSEIESDPEAITKVIKRQIETHETPETEIIIRTVRHVTEVEEDEASVTETSTTVTKTVEVESEPEIITKVIRGEIESHEPSETQVITRTIKHVTESEESAPQITTKVIKREIIQPADDSVSHSLPGTKHQVQGYEPEAMDTITRTIRHVTEIEEGEPEIITKVIRREIVESDDATELESEVITRTIRREVEMHEPSETEVITRTVKHVTEVEETDPEIITKVIKREIVEPRDEIELEPEIITRIIRREVEEHEPSETEVITRTIRHVTEIEDDEPEIITRVIRREIHIPDGEQHDVDHPEGKLETSEIITKSIKTSDAPPETVKRIISREGTPEVTETITTRTTKTIISEAGPPTETITKTTTTTVTSDIEKPELITRIISREGTPEISETITRTTKTTSSDAGPEYITKIINREGTPEIIKTSDVKRIVTTVTTVTGPDGESVTTKDVKESSDKLDSEDLLEKLIDSSSGETKTSEERFVSETPDGLKTEEIIKRTVTTVTSSSGTSTPDVKTFVDSEKSTPDHKQDMKIKTPPKEDTAKPSSEISSDKSGPEIPSSHLIKDIISEDRSYSGMSSPDISLPKDLISIGSTGKSTPDIPVSPLIRDPTSIQGRMLSGRSTPDRKSEGRSRTATPEGFRSGETIRTIITTTRTMSEEGDIITVTKEVTESTNEQGETVVLEEKTNVIRDDKLPSKDAGETAISSVIGSIKASELKRGSSPGSDVMSDRDIGPMSPRSDISSGHSRAATHVWGSSEERHTYSDDEPPSSPLSATSQFGCSPQPPRHESPRYDLPQLPRYELPFDKEKEHKTEGIQSSMMSGSFYGELPVEPGTTSSTKTSHTMPKNSEPIPIQGEYSVMKKRFMVEKEYAGGYDYRVEAKKYVDDADLDFDKAMMEHREKRGEDLVSHHYSNGASATVYTNGNASGKDATTPTTVETKTVGEKKKSDPMAASFSAEKEGEEAGKSGKDPLEGWGKPLYLPSPKPPRKFNLQRPVASTSSEELNPDSLKFDVINNWGEPLRLPSPAPAPTNELPNNGTPGTPKKERKQPKKVVSENNKNKKRSESPNKVDKKSKDTKNKVQPVYMDLTYVPHHGNSFYSSLEFFKRIRARYYVFSGTEPSREVYDALLEAKKTWEDKNLEVTMIPTYDTDTLGYWVADNEEALAANHIDLSPSASRCTINLQDHETSCSAYRLEF